MTACQLVRALAEAGVRFDLAAGRIVVTGEVPPHLEPAAKLLKTGLAALASGRDWWALPEGGRAARIDPRELVPAWAKFLAAGDALAKWDRVPAAARLNLTHLFAPDPPAKPLRAKS